MNFPEQFQNPELRFYQVRKNGKLPREKLWNTKNNYKFFNHQLQEHIMRGGNYGICTGYGQLIVLDFDNLQYYLNKHKQLPKTFTVASATKKLPHMYYYLEDEMFNKIGIDQEGKRVCDIQALKSGVVCPGSSVNKAYYTITQNLPINKITKKQLTETFNITSFKHKTNHNTNLQTDNKQIQQTIQELERLGITRTGSTQFKCPFHASVGGTCLSVFGTGLIHCFHCLNTWNLEEFKEELLKKTGGIKK